MDPKHQLTDSNNYTPSARASAAMSAAGGDNHHPVYTDGQNTKQSDTAPAGSGKSDMPAQNVGGSPPADPRVGAHAYIDPGATRGVRDQKA